MAKKIVAGVAVVLGFLVGLIMMQPASTQVNRTVDIQATPAQVMGVLARELDFFWKRVTRVV